MAKRNKAYEEWSRDIDRLCKPTPIIEVDDNQDEYRGCNCCIDGKPEVEIKLGVNNQSVSIIVCRRCLLTLLKKGYTKYKSIK